MHRCITLHPTHSTGYILSVSMYVVNSHCYQLGAHNAPGWSYSYFVQFSCLSVHLSVRASLGRPGNMLMAAAGTYGCFELAGLFASSLQRKQNDPSTIDSRDTGLVTLAQYRKSSSRSKGTPRNRWLTQTNKPRSEIAIVLQYSVSYK